jgi:hypothetical protein
LTDNRELTPTHTHTHTHPHPHPHPHTPTPSIYPELTGVAISHGKWYDIPKISTSVTAGYISSNTCMNFITSHRNNQWLGNLFTGDEKWFLYVKHRRRCQCLSRGQTGVATPKVDSHSKTLMLSVLWGSEEQLIEIFFQSGVQSPPLSAVSS